MASLKEAGGGSGEQASEKYGMPLLKLEVLNVEVGSYSG